MKFPLKSNDPAALTELYGSARKQIRGFRRYQRASAAQVKSVEMEGSIEVTRRIRRNAGGYSSL